MKQFLWIVLGFLATSCNDLVSEDKEYTGDPIVCLSSEQAIVQLSKENPTSGLVKVFKDSVLISTPITEDLKVYIAIDQKKTTAKLDEHYSMQQEVVIPAGSYFGYFTFEGLEIPEEDVSKLDVAVYIDSVSNPNVIPGFYGVKYELAEREKRTKIFSFNN